MDPDRLMSTSPKIPSLARQNCSWQQPAPTSIPGFLSRRPVAGLCLHRNGAVSSVRAALSGHGRWRQMADLGSNRPGSLCGRAMTTNCSMRELTCQIMAAGYTLQKAGYSFPGQSRKWSSIPILATSVYPLIPHLSPDGKRLVVFPRAGNRCRRERATVHVNFLLNFFDEMKEKDAVIRGDIAHQLCLRPVRREPGSYFFHDFPFGKTQAPAEVQREAPKIRRSGKYRLRADRQKPVPRSESKMLRTFVRVPRDTSRTRSRAICIPPAPDASASTLPARAPCAGCGVHFNRRVNELLHEEAYFLNHAPSCDDTAHGEV